MRRKISTPPKHRQFEQQSTANGLSRSPRKKQLEQQSEQQSAAVNVKTPTSGKGAHFLKHQIVGVSVVLLAIMAVLRNHLDTNEENELIDPLPSTFGGVGRTKDVLWKPRIVAAKAQIDLSKLSSEHLQEMGVDPVIRIELSKEGISAQQRILDSDEYSKKAEPLYTDDPPCEPQHEWQIHSHPSCQTLHEVGMTDMLLPESDSADDDTLEKFRFLASGGYRDVYMFRDYNWEKLALKTLKYSRDFTERHFDRHKRDAIAADRLTAVASSVDIYGFCGQSALYQFAKGGNLKNAINKHIIRPLPEMTWNSTQKLRVAYMVATSIADLHNVDMEGRASIAHTDISTDQFISIKGDGYFQLNDFNRARFLKRNTEDASLNCPFFVKSNKGKFRSPEEYLYLPETEAVDTYSMGNIFFVLLTGEYPFLHLSKKEVKKAVGSKGERPDFGDSFLKSSDPNEQALIEAAKMCWAQDPKDRANAREVQLFLRSKLS